MLGTPISGLAVVRKRPVRRLAIPGFRLQNRSTLLAFFAPFGYNSVGIVDHYHLSA
jgi:hypothetical protein